MSTVVLYCWCHSDSASVLLYFTLKYIPGSFVCKEFQINKYKIHHQLLANVSSCQLPFHIFFSNISIIIWLIIIAPLIETFYCLELVTLYFGRPFPFTKAYCLLNVFHDKTKKN